MGTGRRVLRTLVSAEGGRRGRTVSVQGRGLKACSVHVPNRSSGLARAVEVLGAGGEG